MKVSIILILFLCLVSEVFSQFYEEDDSLQFKRSEFFSTQRVFPYDSIPSAAYNRAYVVKNTLRQQNGYYLAPNYNWTPLGPAPVNMQFQTNHDASGRTKMVLFNPQNPNVAYIASAGGGLWKTSNVWAPRTSVTWTHLTWNLPPINVLASGAFCIDPYDPTGNTIYYGTGEATNFWSYNNVGDGIYKSTDGGITWVKGQGLPLQTKVYRIIVRGSQNRNIIYAALGTTYWHNPYIQSRNCGLYKSIDGGLNWTVEPWSENLHCTDIAFNPQNDLIGYCIGPPNGGPGTYEPGTGYWRTTDGGASWFFVGESAFDHTGYHDDTYLSISPTNPNYIYVLTCEYGTIAYRSSDGGNTFKYMGNHHFDAMWDYNMVIRVSPYDPNIVFVGDKHIMYTTNAGAEPCSTVVWNQLWPGSNYVHDDTHYIDFEPQTGPPPESLPNYRFLVTCDGGVYRTTNGGTTFESLNESSNPENCLNTSLLYSVANNPFDENRILGSAQDNAIQVRNGSNYWTYSTGTWGDGMYVCMSQVKKDNAIYFHIPSYIIGFSTNGGSSFTTALNVVHNSFIPLVSHPTEPGTFYLAQTDLWKSNNNGASWTQPWDPNGNHKIDNTDPYHTYYVNALDVVNSDLIYAATYYNDIWNYTNNVQHLWRTTNSGQIWDNLHIEQKGFVNRFITSVKVNKSNNDEVLVTLSGFSNPPNDGHHIYRTLNGGTNWQNMVWEDITGNLSQMDAPVNDLVIYDAGLTIEKYIIATDVGVYISDASDPSHIWQELGSNLPNASCLKLDYFRPSKKLRVATFGVGAWEIPLDANEPIYVKDNMFLNSYSNGLNISQDIVVCSGGQLNVLENCTLKFAEGKKIIVKNGGKMIMSGNPPIVFTKQDNASSWGGIVFENGGYGTIKNSIFNNTQNNTAIFVDYTSSSNEPIAPNTYIIIQDCDFNQGAVQVNGDNYRNVYIDNNTFNGNGIEVSYSNPVYITNNIMTNGAGISVSASSLEISHNTITTSGICLDGCYAPTLKSNIVTGVGYNLFLFNSSPIMFDNTLNCTDNNGISIYTNYLSFPRLRPTSSNDNIIWDAGFNKINATNGGTDIFYMEASADIDQGSNFMNAGSFYLTEYIVPTPINNTYYATGNCWDGGATDPNKFALHDQLGNPITVIYNTTNCTPPFSAVFNESNTYNAGGNKYPDEFSSGLISNIDPEPDPPMPYIRDLGNGYYDTINVTNGNLNLTVDEALYSSGIKEELNNNYPAAVNIYKQIVTNYHANISAIKALIRILTCTDKIVSDTGRYTTLGNYYANVNQAYSADTILMKVANELSHKVLVRKGEYAPAITNYENDIQNTNDSLEVLCYQLNIVEIYMLFENGGGDNPAFTGKLSYLKPSSKQDGFKKIQELLHHFKSQKENKTIPNVYSLSQNYPNPFNPLTKINYSLPQGTKVSIKIFDVLGRLVKELVNEYKDAGNYTVTFDGSNIASGVYFYKIEVRQGGSSTVSFTDTKKMVLIK
jgi:photosystem II stability/assembly factor-like uncharacterized protein